MRRHPAVVNTAGGTVVPMDRPGASRAARIWGAVLPLVMLAAGCRAPQARQADHRAASVYGAIIVVLAGRAGTGEPPVAFVRMRDGTKPLALDVQATIVKDLAKQVTVRFLDDDRGALDDKAVDRPVTDGVLLRLGPVSALAGTAEVQVERYRRVGDQHLITLSVSGEAETWTAQVVADTPYVAGS